MDEDSLESTHYKQPPQKVQRKRKTGTSPAGSDSGEISSKTKIEVQLLPVAIQSQTARSLRPFRHSTQYTVLILAGPSPGCSSRGGKNQKEGPKTRRGGHVFKYSIGCMQQPVGQAWNGGGTDFKRGPGTTGPPAGDGPGYLFEKVHSLVPVMRSIVQWQSSDHLC